MVMNFLSRHLLPVLLLAAISSGVTAADPKASKYYEDAVARYDRQDLAGTIIQLKNALKAEPDMLAAHVLLARALLDNGDPVGAEVEADVALKLGVGRAEVLPLLGQAYLLQGKYGTLLDRVTPGGLPLTTQVKVLVMRANAQAEEGHPQVALKTLDEARSLDPRAPAVLLAQAAIYLRNGDMNRAAVASDQAMALAPDDADAWTMRASLLQLRGDRQGALEAYAKAVSFKPKYLDPRVARAGLLVDMGRMDEAGRELDQILAIEPREPRANYLKAVVAASRGDTTVAKAALQQVTRLLDPVSAAVLARNRQMLLLSGLAHYELGDQEKAMEKLTAYVHRFPGEPGPSKVLASLYLDRGDAALALSLLEPLQSSSPNDPRVLSLLATAYMKQRNFRKASELLDQAVAASGGAADIQTDFGLSLVGAGKTDSAVAQLEKTFNKDPKQTRAGIVLTILYMRRNDTARALDVIQRLVRAEPGNLVALNLMGAVQASAGDRAGGRRTLEQVLATDAGYLPATLNLVRLDVAEGKYDAARQRLAPLLKGNNRNLDAMMELAGIEEGAGNVAEAVNWLEKARAEPKGALRAGMALGELYLRNGKLDQALSVARELTAKSPEDLGVLGLLARVQIARNDGRSAQDTLKDMTRYANFDAVSQVQIARLQILAGNDSGASYSLDKALDGKPDFLPALALYAEVEIRRKAFTKAEQRIRTISDKHPEATGQVARLRGDLALAQGQHAAALASYGEALKKDGGNDLALRILSAYSESGQLAKGVAFLEKWRRDHPGDPLLMNATAEGYLRLGRFKEAGSIYEQLLKLRPDDGLVLNNLALIARKLGNPEALSLAERAYKLRPNDPLVIDTLGWILVGQTQFDRALTLLRDARLRDPVNPEIRYHLAVALDKTGRRKEARDELAEALKAKVAFEGADDARRLWSEINR